MLAVIERAWINLHARSLIKFWGERFVRGVVRDGCESWNPLTRWYWRKILYRVEELLDQALNRRFMAEMARYLSEME